MRTQISLALVLAALAACSACDSSKDPDPPQTCTLGALGDACGGGAQCCSGSCANGICVKPANECTAAAAACGEAFECCSGSCPAGNCCVTPGGSCAGAQDCCAGDCTNFICLEANPLPDGSPCTADAQCQSGYCDPTAPRVCAQRPCLDEGLSCMQGDQCCSAVCDAATSTCTQPSPLCNGSTEPCDYDRDCCSRNCVGTEDANGLHAPGSACGSETCEPEGQACSLPEDCCSRTCSTTCQGLPGGTCEVLGERCALPTDCCSRNCQGASGTGASDGTCMPVAPCNATGDVCSRGEDCCSGLCSGSGGLPGRCEDAPGGCGLDGYPCATDSSCCTKKCVDLGTGAKACQPSGGCRLNGNYCDSTNACCNVNYKFTNHNQWVECDPVDHVCLNGTGCNPPGDICGYKASQDCCFGKKSVCKPDMNGILRCFGGPETCCPEGGECAGCCLNGWDGNDPNCCIALGEICQFRDQCCGYAPCVPDASGVLRCTLECKPRGMLCTATGECCAGLSCENIEGRTVCTDPPTSCTVAPGGACVVGSSAPAECCISGTCAGGLCPTSCATSGSACDPAASNCCQGLLCTSVPGTSGGTCAACAPIGNSCSASTQCCSGNCGANGTCEPPCTQEGHACTAHSECCSFFCDMDPGATSGLCGPPGGCSVTGANCAVDADCCNYVPAGGGDTCVNNVCTAPQHCDGAGVACTFGSTNCCNPLVCVDIANNQACTASSPTCSCGTVGECPTIVNQLGCSPPLGVECCTGICLATATGVSCTAQNLNDCKCQVCPDATNQGDCTNEVTGPNCCSGFCVQKSNTSMSCTSANPADCKCIGGA